eukprot:gene3918-2783_t
MTVILVIGSDEIQEIDDRLEIAGAIAVIEIEGVAEIVVETVVIGVSTAEMIEVVDQSMDHKKTVRSAVICKERDGKSGRGVVIQDINAPAAICMERIRDVESYIHVVPHVKKVEVYENRVFSNGTSKTGAEFKVGLMGLSFQYFLQLTHEPKYNTLTWTLDYSKSSDFDDNVGHWQVMPHPSKRGWTRLLYSTKIRAFSWIPEFFVNFLTSKALTESTSWVKREAELAASRLPNVEPPAIRTSAPKTSWFNIKGGFVNNPLHLSCDESQRKMQLRKLQSYRQFPRLSLRFLKK